MFTSIHILYGECVKTATDPEVMVANGSSRLAFDGRYAWQAKDWDKMKQV